MTTSANTFHVITVVWGRPYIDVFLDAALPNQLTPGNLDALPAGSRYRVFTSPEDLATLAASAMLDRVRELIPVDLEVMPELSDSAVDPLRRMTDAQCRAMADAPDAQVAFIFLNADHFMSEGALEAVVRRHAAGHRAVVCTGMRLKRGEFVTALRARGGVRALPSRELASLALDHLHPFTLAHMTDAPYTACSPASIHWNVPGEGILTRSFFLTALMVDPVRRDALPRGTLDAKYVGRACPGLDKVHIVTDSDELLLVELSRPEDGVIETAPGGISRWLAAIMLHGCGSPRYWTTPTRVHVREIGPAWDPVERESARFAARVMRLRGAARAMFATARRIKRLRRHAGVLAKHVRIGMRPLSPARVRRSGALAIQRMKRFRKRTARFGRLTVSRARRSAVLLMDSATRPVTKLRKRVVRASRRVFRRAHAVR